ncbi:MAG TPA: NTP transferase domain-containing protein [Propionibacteriaceae bacterium]|nr:NTP transferase domain-containing protein [Propionibacteriaceae bacterium]
MAAAAGPQHSRYAVVLAGGESRRFGADKLAAPVEGRPLLDQAIADLPQGMTVLVVGPARSLSRPVRFLREHPAGGGPAAAMVTGLAAALAAGASQIVVLPGDAPRAGQAARLLMDALTGAPRVSAVVGTDASGFDQPLQLALLPFAADALISAAGAEGGNGASARALVNQLDPPAMRCRLPREASFDIDTPVQLREWTDRSRR